MGVKIYNVGMKNVKLSSIQTGPDFFTYRGINLNGLYPAIGNRDANFGPYLGINMGQNAFQGDPLGFQAYDSNYDSTLWRGYQDVSGDDMRVRNSATAWYLKNYTSGKYYYEIECKSIIREHAIGMVSGDKDGTDPPFFRENNAIYIYNVDYAQNPMNKRIYINGAATTRTWYEPGIASPDIIQVYIDFDSGSILIKKLGTTSEDYTNIE